MRALRKEFIILRRKRIVTACAALLFAVTGHAQDTSIRPFMVNVPEEAFVDLRRRLAATRWPSRETVADQSQGMQLAKLEELVRHWGTNYDWRKAHRRHKALFSGPRPVEDHAPLPGTVANGHQPLPVLGQRDRRDEARHLLGDVYARFTEGFDAANLADARALLAELS
jgi:hypothetical protein